MSKKIHTADVANAAVRNILCEISTKMFDSVTPKYLEEAAAYFGYECPYTGKSIKDEILGENGKSISDLQMDHIIPENKIYLGLNVIGNTVYVCKEANNLKSKYDKEYDNKQYSYERVIDALCDDPIIRAQRKDKIRKFQEEYGYDKLLNACESIKEDVLTFYKETQKRQREFISNTIKKLNKNDLKVSKDIEDFCVFLEKKGRTPNVIKDYRYVLIRVIIENLNSIKELAKKKTILDLITLYSEGGEKYSPTDHKTISVLRAYAEYKKISLYDKKTKVINKNQTKFIKFLCKQNSAKTGKKISQSTANNYVSCVDRALREYGYSFDDTLLVSDIDKMITDYKTIKQTKDKSGSIKAGLEFYKKFISTL